MECIVESQEECILKNIEQDVLKYNQVNLGGDQNRPL